MKWGTVRGVCLLALLATLVACLGCTARDDGEPGSLVVTIARAAEAAWMVDEEIMVELSPGGAVATWSPDSPAVFTGLRPGQRYAVHLPPRFLAEPRTVTALSDRPVRIVMGVLAFSSLADLLGPDFHRSPEKALYVDTTADPASWQLQWRQGHLLISRLSVPRDPATLTEVATREWKLHGGHQDPADQRSDQAVVVVGAEAALHDAATIVAALGLVRRTVRVRSYDRSGRGDRSENRPVFTVRLARPEHVKPPPPPPELGPSGYDGPAPTVEVVVTDCGTALPCEAVRAAVARARPRLRRCHEHGLARDPDLYGGLRLRFQVGLDGRSGVGRPSFEELSYRLADQWVTHCVIETFQSLRYPRHGGGDATVAVRVELTPAERERPNGRDAL